MSKFTLKRFQSIARAVLQIGGTVAVTIPTTSPYVAIAGAAFATIGVVWGQINVGLGKGIPDAS